MAFNANSRETQVAGNQALIKKIAQPVAPAPGISDKQSSSTRTPQSQDMIASLPNADGEIAKPKPKPKLQGKDLGKIGGAAKVATDASQIVQEPGQKFQQAPEGTYPSIDQGPASRNHPDTEEPPGITAGQEQAGGGQETEMTQFFDDLMGKEEERQGEVQNLQQQQASQNYRRQMEMSAQLGQSVGGGGFAAGQGQAQIQASQDMTKAGIEHLDRMRDLSMKQFEEGQRGRERSEDKEFQKERDMMGQFAEYQRQMQQMAMDNPDLYTESGGALDYETWKSQFEGGGAVTGPSTELGTEPDTTTEKGRAAAGDKAFDHVKKRLDEAAWGTVQELLQETGGNMKQAESLYWSRHDGGSLVDMMQVLKAMGGQTYGLDTMDPKELAALRKDVEAQVVKFNANRGDDVAEWNVEGHRELFDAMRNLRRDRGE